MRRILNSHPQVYIAKETGFLPALIERGQHCEAREAVKLVNSYLCVEKWHARLEESQLPDAAEGKVDIAKLYQYVCHLESTANDKLLYWGDNTPQYVSIATMLYQMFPDARFIHLVRDPRDVVASIIDLPFRGNTPYLAAVEWLSRIGDWLIAERKIPAIQRIEVKYENLVQKPEIEISRILNFLELEDQEIQWENKSDEVAQLPHHARLNAPIDATSVGRHLNILNKRELAEVEAITRQAMLAYDYKPHTTYTISPILADDWKSMFYQQLKDIMIRIRRRGLRIIKGMFVGTK